MDVRYPVVVLEAADLAAVSAFWAAVLGGTVDAEDDWHMVMDGDGTPRIGVQLAPNHVPPGVPGGTQQQLLPLGPVGDGLRSGASGGHAAWSNCAPGGPGHYR